MKCKRLFPLLLLVSLSSALLSSCMYFEKVTGNSAIVRFDLSDNTTTIPYSRWDIEVKSGKEENLWMETTSTKLPLSIYMKDLTEWTVYQVKITYVRVFWIQGKEYDYSQHIVCEGNFTTVPRIIKMDSVDQYPRYYYLKLLGTAQIWNPQNYKFRFEWGSAVSYEYSDNTRFKDLIGVGVAVDRVDFFRPESPLRVRLVIKSKPPWSETYISDPISVYSTI